jgi:hypothetical protein
MRWIAQHRLEQSTKRAAIQECGVTINIGVMPVITKSCDGRWDWHAGICRFERFRVETHLNAAMAHNSFC